MSEAVRASRWSVYLMTSVLAFYVMSAAALAATPRWMEMDYGPFLTSSVTMHPPKDPERVTGVTPKAITVKLGLHNGPASADGALCFDTNLLRCAGAWTGGWLDLYGTPFDGTHRPPEKSRPAVKGTMLFETGQMTPGWGKPGEDDLAKAFADPRAEPYIPLPRNWAHWRGLYVNGGRVVFSYTVGECEILETPTLAKYEQASQVISRTFSVGPCEQSLTLLVREGAKFEKPAIVPPPVTLAGQPPVEDGQADKNVVVGGDIDCGVTAVPKGTVWLTDGPRVFLRIPARKEQAVFTVLVGRGNRPDVRAVNEYYGPVKDPAKLTRGGESRFATPIETVGKLGKADADASYVVDTLTLPDDNPWKSWMRLGGFDFFKDGKSVAVCTWSGDVWTVSGIDDSLAKLTWRRVASGLFQPLGLKIVDEVIYVLGRDQITRLRDLNGDGEFDFYENFNNDVSVTPNFHEFALDLEQDPVSGDFFFTKGAPLLGTELLDPIGAHNGCVVRVSKNGSKMEAYATGLRAPNGAGISPKGEIACSDNQGIWTPACRINLIKQGGFYGLPGTSHRTPEPTDYDRPLCWIPMPTDNSSGDECWVPDDRWGPFAGEMLHFSYGKCSLFHVLRDEVDGVAQGAVVKFPLKFDTGSMRSRFNPADGQLYVAGLKGWQTDAARDGALQRVRYTGKPVRALAGLKITKDGIDLSFTTPVDPKTAGDAGSYAMEWWNYRWTKAYGSPDFKVSDPNKQGRDKVNITAAKLSADGKTVSITIPDLKPVMQYALQIDIESADGKPIKTKAEGTIHKTPARPR